MLARRREKVWLLSKIATGAAAQLRHRFYSAALSRTIQAAMTLQRLVLFLLVSRNKQALRQMLAMEHFQIACRNVGIT